MTSLSLDYGVTTPIARLRAEPCGVVSIEVTPYEVLSELRWLMFSWNVLGGGVEGRYVCVDKVKDLSVYSDCC